MREVEPSTCATPSGRTVLQGPKSDYGPWRSSISTVWSVLGAIRHNSGEQDSSPATAELNFAANTAYTVQDRRSRIATMSTHQIMSFAEELSTKLASRSRHVCVLLGAGASKACGLPDVNDLQKQVINGLNDEEQAFVKHQLAKDRNLEQILSRLRRIAALLDDNTAKVDDLTAQQARDLDKKVCQLIVNALKVNYSSLSPMLNFVIWAGRADYKLPVEIFTTNYDLALETALESFGVTYFDGFIGALRARFHTELVEANIEDTQNWLPSFLLRVWKLHGSVNWEWINEPNTEVVRLGTKVSGQSPAAIYPSDAKYSESRRVPFVVLQDRFRRALHQPETLMLISGYSFSDEHINEMIFSAVRRRPRSEYIAFCFDDIPEPLAKVAIPYPNLQAVGPSEAIIKGVKRNWKADKSDSIPDYVRNENKLALVDFINFANYLAKDPISQFEHNDSIREPLISEHY